MTAILDGKRVLGNPNEIREVKNAYDTYELLLSLNPYSVEEMWGIMRKEAFPKDMRL